MMNCSKHFAITEYLDSERKSKNAFCFDNNSVENNLKNQGGSPHILKPMDYTVKIYSLYNVLSSFFFVFCKINLFLLRLISFEL